MLFPMHLAKEQRERFEKFKAENPEKSRRENRLAFFSQHYEIQISYTIMKDLAASDEYSTPPITSK